MASAISVAMAKLNEVHLVYCFEKNGVLKNIEDENSVISTMNYSEYEKYKTENIISKGMIPKLDNAFDAIKSGVKSVSICHAKDLEYIFKEEKAGTKLL